MNFNPLVDYLFMNLALPNSFSFGKMQTSLLLLLLIHEFLAINNNDALGGIERDVFVVIHYIIIMSICRYFKYSS